MLMSEGNPIGFVDPLGLARDGLWNNTKGKWSKFTEWLENYTVESEIKSAKRMLETRGINENCPDYTQMLVDEILFQRKMYDMATGSAGGIKLVGNVGKGIISLIKNDKRLVNAAQLMGKNQVVQKEADELVLKLLKGNVNPGTGSKNLFRNVLYLRGRNGARVFYRNTSNGVEILAKASKENEALVIRVLEQLYK